MENIDDNQIGLTKFQADSSKYFSLFDKHIPKFENDGADKKFLLLGLDNIDMMLKCCALNASAEYWVAEQTIVSAMVPRSGPQFKFKFFDKNLELYNITKNCDFKFFDKNLDLYDIIKNCDMKFDCIIMNPPYERNLHLKILAEAIKHLKDEKSICVNLSPVRWLQDPINRIKNKGDYKRFNESICNHLISIDIITAQNAQRCFPGTVINMDLGVYTCNNFINSVFNYDALSQNQILTKCEQYICSHNPILEENKQVGWRVRMPLILGGKSGGSGDRKIGLLNFGKLLNFNNGKYKDGKWWYECYVKNQYSKTTPYITLSICFNSEIESLNFISQFDTNFVKYITNVLVSDVHIAPEKIVWMGDAINPRTGEKGYKSEWTDEDFYQFFDITPDEQKIIEDTMAKYK